MTNLLDPGSLRPGESRRTYTTLSDAVDGGPVPAGVPFQQLIAVEEVCPAGEAYAPPPLEWLTIFLTLHGSAYLDIGPHSLSHRPGSLLVVASGCTIRERVSGTQPWHVRYLLLTGSWARQMDEWLRRREPAVAVWASAPARPGQICSEMVDLVLTQRDGWQWPFLSRTAELWGAIYSDAASASPSETLVMQVGRLIDEAPAERPSVAELAARLHLTPRQLLYRFHAATGEPLAGWVRRRRVAAAHRLLSQGRSVTDVASQLGFANPYHFSRAFKSVTGATPSAVRAAVRRGALHAGGTSGNPG